MIIRQARPDDAESITSLLIRSIRELCGPDYDMDESLLAAWCANKTPENMRRWMEHPTNHFMVLEAEGEIRGVSLITSSGSIRICYLLPGNEGKGYGKALLMEMIAFARSLGLQEVTLESTRTARAFYIRHGFVELGEVGCVGDVPGYAMCLKL